MKNVHVFVPVFLYAVTMLIFQIKRIISSEKWCNYVVTFSFFENAKNFGRSDDAKRRKKKEDGLMYTTRGGGAEDWGVLKFVEGKGGGGKKF